jgi:hypothetical protein
MIKAEWIRDLAGEAGSPKKVVAALRRDLPAVRFRMATAFQGAVIPRAKM